MYCSVRKVLNLAHLLLRTHSTLIFGYLWYANGRFKAGEQGSTTQLWSIALFAYLRPSMLSNNGVPIAPIWSSGTILRLCHWWMPLYYQNLLDLVRDLRNLSLNDTTAIEPSTKNSNVYVKCCKLICKSVWCCCQFKCNFKQMGTFNSAAV